MTEPEVASSDATNIATRIERDGDHYVINGRKWWTSGAMSPRCKLLIVMGVTDPDAERHRRQSMILVPKDTPGVTVLRSTSLFGYDDGPHGGHAEVIYDNVRVPAANLLGDEGDGFRLAQERLGPGRIHHAMRAIGMAERALEMMCRRAASALDVRQADHRPRRRPAMDLGGPGADRAGPPAGAQDRVADGYGRQPRRSDRGVGDQGRRARRWRPG